MSLPADRVRLFSPLATLLSGIAAVGIAEGAGRVAAIQMIAEAMGVPEASQMASVVQGLSAVQTCPDGIRENSWAGQRSRELHDHLGRWREPGQSFAKGWKRFSIKQAPGNLFRHLKRNCLRSSLSWKAKRRTLSAVDVYDQPSCVFGL